MITKVRREIAEPVPTDAGARLEEADGGPVEARAKIRHEAKLRSKCWNGLVAPDSTGLPKPELLFARETPGLHHLGGRHHIEMSDALKRPH